MPFAILSIDNLHNYTIFCFCFCTLGLNDKNLEYVAKAVHAVTDGKSITSN